MPCKQPQWRLILASASPRRKVLLAEMGLEFEVVVPPLPEPQIESADSLPRQVAESLAYFKARAVAEMHPDALVLGADTVVAAGDRLLGKAADARQARRMLGELSGTRHRVITGVALLSRDLRIVTSETTYVTMVEMTATQIDDYVDSREWVDKAGAYAIQETADRYVLATEGSFSNVVGLPTELLEGILARLDSFAPRRQD